MSEILGVDYSEGYPGGAALAAEGMAFACRYLGTDSRCITVAEKNDLNAHGIKIVLIKETDGLGFRNGEAPGRIDATNAQADIVRVGLPINAPVYFTVDDEFNPQDGPGMTAYMQAAEKVLRSRKRMALYGPLAAINYAKQHGLATYYWQTSGWSGIPTVWSPGNNMEQFRYDLTINGVSCDLNRAFTADYGQAYGGPAPDVIPPKPKPGPVPGIALPKGMTLPLLKRLFTGSASNEVVIGGETERFDPNGKVSRSWLQRGIASIPAGKTWREGSFPQLKDRVVRGKDGKDGTDFVFGDGSTIHVGKEN